MHFLKIFTTTASPPVSVASAQYTCSERESWGFDLIGRFTSPTDRSGNIASAYLVRSKIACRSSHMNKDKKIMSLSHATFDENCLGHSTLACLAPSSDSIHDTTSDWLSTVWSPVGFSSPAFVLTSCRYLSFDTQLLFVSRAERVLILCLSGIIAITPDFSLEKRIQKKGSVGSSRHCDCFQQAGGGLPNSILWPAISHRRSTI
ncbi:hypothetical protein F4859DRAFT_341890 [Xylaria cf. heliscus]|nr:hypothetical protein F4859DRAFT_341890 [Xylaria cf. heliscus]